MIDDPVPVTFRTDQDVRDYLERFTLGAEERTYMEWMLPRYLRALAFVDECLKARAAKLPAGTETTIADVAPHFLSELMAAAFRSPVNTIGIDYRLDPPHPRLDDHLTIDLNTLHAKDGWRGFWRHDVVFMGEIIEHLWASPRMVLGGIARWIKPGGYLVLQTPNAAALERRLMLLFGKNPYEMLREGTNPGHIREYTADELIPLALDHGLDVVKIHYENYFRIPSRGPVKRALYGAVTALRGTLRDGMTLVFKKRPGDDPPLESHVIHGQLDHVALEDGHVVAKGWATDAARRAPAQSVEVLCGDDVLLTIEPTIDRPDVAADLGPTYACCGFEARVAIDGIDPQELRVRVTDGYGDARDLGSG
ncbi:MAG: hypothetical protein CMJ83_22245 [Planctomycetes bacterium]|nr:hypothetical protein [Planctomycetota bacterium]